jgi:phospholipid/cholesterol/gamma-HCH transport system ATP-binding protein
MAATAAQRAHAVGVELRAVRKRYDGEEVLRGVDLSVRPGELLAIVGQSGTGKSVLLRQIIGLERPDGGDIQVGGLPLPDYLATAPEAKPFRIAMVFQSAALLASLTVAENVALRLREGRRHDARQIAAITREVLDAVELAGSEDRLPGQLSGGMRKRVAIARALAVDPELILYDEPTADLDPILTEQIGELIRRIRRSRGSTQIIVSHNLALARALADRIAVLADGRIAECVTPAELTASRHPLTRAFLHAAALGHEETKPC